MGKTEGGLLWIGDNKGFFILPLKAAINAIYERTRNLLNNEKIDVKLALLHSDILSKYNELDNELDLLNYVVESKKLSIPLTISTLDQIFDFVFKYNGYELKLATLSYSKIVIDEIQMYSTDLLAFLIYGIEKIIEVGGSFAILTATLPPFITEFMEKNIQDFSYEYGEFCEDNVRHNVKVYDEELTKDSVINFYNKVNGNCKLLVICNTVKKGQEIYKELIEEGISEKELNILHSKFIKKDRDKLECEILNFGKSERQDRGIWITTQVVEVSLDIDFDYLITELSDINGLFQRFGRCNRKGLKSTDTYNCFVYLKINNRLLKIRNSGFIDKDIYSISKAILQDMDGKLSEQTKLNLIKDNFTYEKLRKSDFIRELKKGYEYIKETPPYQLKKNEVIKKFRNIISYRVIPNEIYVREESVINEYLKIYNDVEQSLKDRIIAKDSILSFVVSVGKYDIDFRNGIIKEIEIGYDKIRVVKCKYGKVGFEKVVLEDKKEVFDNFY